MGLEPVFVTSDCGGLPGLPNRSRAFSRPQKTVHFQDQPWWLHAFLSLIYSSPTFGADSEGRSVEEGVARGESNPGRPRDYKVRSPAWSSDGSPLDLPAPTSWCSPTLLPGTRAWAGVPVNRSQPLSPGCSFSRLLFPYPPLSLHLDL